MAYSPPEYPGAIPDFAEIWPTVDDVSWMVTAAWDAMVKELRASLIELGVDPAGTYETVVARLDDLGVPTYIELNIMLNAFRIAINGSLVKHNMVDGIMDEFEDESGVDTGASANEDYDAVNDLYEPASGVQLIDSYSETNKDTDWESYDGYREGLGQAITLASGASITSVKFYLKKVGSPTGNVYAKLYASTGTVGTNATPTGAALATSDAVDVSGIGTSYALVEFTFSTPYVASAGDICLVLTTDGIGDASDKLLCGGDSVASTHAGNLFRSHDMSSWLGFADYDFCFYLYGDVVTDMTLISQATTADAQPDDARMVLFEEDVDAVTINTDLKAWVSRDGSTYTQITLTDEGDYGGGKRILTGTVDISGQPGGTTMQWKVTTHNAKNLKLHGVGELWN